MAAGSANHRSPCSSDRGRVYRSEKRRGYRNRHHSHVPWGRVGLRHGHDVGNVAVSPYRVPAHAERRNFGVAPVGIQAIALTDGLGRYSLPGVSGVATIRASLSGPACKIIDDQAGPKNDDFAKYTHDLGGANVDVDYYSGTTEEAKLAQTSAFFSVNQAFEFVKEFLPDRPTKLPQAADIRQSGKLLQRLLRSGRRHVELFPRNG